MVIKVRRKDLYRALVLSLGVSLCITPAAHATQIDNYDTQTVEDYSQDDSSLAVTEEILYNPGQAEDYTEETGNEYNYGSDGYNSSDQVQGVDNGDGSDAIEETAPSEEQEHGFLPDPRHGDHHERHVDSPAPDRDGCGA